MAGYISDDTRKVTTHRLVEMKQRGEKISMLTAYDYTMAQIVDGAGMDVILVGDSASNVMAGNVTTLPITLDQMIYHAASVVRGVKRALVVVDMPFGSYQGNSKEALNSAIRIMKETAADAIKLEGGEEILESIQRILSAGIPVMGHLGLTPQSIHKFGTYAIRAKKEEEAEKLVHDAHLLEEAGCFAIVLEKIPAALAARVAQEVSIPIIGIGAGAAAHRLVLQRDLMRLGQLFQLQGKVPVQGGGVAQHGAAAQGTGFLRRAAKAIPKAHIYRNSIVRLAGKAAGLGALAAHFLHAGEQHRYPAVRLFGRYFLGRRYHRRAANAVIQGGPRQPLVL